MLCKPRRWKPGGASPIINQVTSKGTTGSMRKKWEWAPAAKGASPKQVGSRESKGKNASGRLKWVSNKSPKMKRIPYLNPDAFCRFIGPKNLGKVLVDDELVTCLLDNGVQLNFITPAYTQERGMDIMSLDYLAEEIGGAILHISGIGSISGTHWVHYDER